MSTEEEVSNCYGCGAQPGQTHKGGCDVARCRNSGYQYISCDLAEVDEEGEYLPDELASHHCFPDVWDGEWPGTKQCREFGWYTTVKDFRGEFVCPDYSRLLLTCDWNIEMQRWERRENRN
jgi:hypothetical protein